MLLFVVMVVVIVVVGVAVVVVVVTHCEPRSCLGCFFFLVCFFDGCIRILRHASHCALCALFFNVNVLVGK